MKFTSRGFSVIELLIILGILGIIAAISVPIYQQLKPILMLNSVIRDMASDIRYGQQMAVTEQIIYHVDIFPLTNTYTLTNSQSNMIIKSVSVPAVIKIASTTGFTANKIRFTSTGAAIESGSIFLNNGHKTSTIEIKPSGYVKITN